MPRKPTSLVELIKNPTKGEEEFLLDLLVNRIPAGVDEAAYVKAGFLAAVAKGEVASPILSAELATELLGTMLGGYNVAPLIELLDNPKMAAIAAKALSHTLLIFDAFHGRAGKGRGGQCLRQAGHPVLGGCRVVHQQAGHASEVDRDGV